MSQVLIIILALLRIVIIILDRIPYEYSNVTTFQIVKSRALVATEQCNFPIYCVP